jgi:single-strand DNA-binding protein
MMSHLNSILIEGCLTRDPQFRSDPEGESVCTFEIASNHSYKSGSRLEEEASFFDVETWGKLAENCRVFGRAGRGVRAVGRLKQERWDGDDGKFHAKVFIVAEHVEFRPELQKEESPPESGFTELPFQPPWRLEGRLSSNRRKPEKPRLMSREGVLNG